MTLVKRTGNDREQVTATVAELQVRLESERAAMDAATQEEINGDTIDEIAAAQARQNAIRTKIGRTEKALADAKAKLDVIDAQDRRQAARERAAELANLQAVQVKQLDAIRRQAVAALVAAAENYRTTREAAQAAQVEFLTLAGQILPGNESNSLEWLATDLQPLGADLSCVGIEFVQPDPRDLKSRGNWLSRWTKVTKIPAPDLGPPGATFDTLVRDYFR